MDPHSYGTILINAPVTYVWRQLWENFLEQNDLTKGTIITKKKADQIHRTVTINQQSRKQEISRHQKQRTIRNKFVQGNQFGQITYEIQHGPKGEVFLKISSSVIDQHKRHYPNQAVLDYELAQHKERIQYRQKHPMKKGICC